LEDRLYSITKVITKKTYTNPATFASKSVNNITAAYDGYFRVTLSCSKGVAYFENLDIDIERTETVITNNIETDVLNSSDYYPFGLRMVKNSAPSTDYRYGYQGDFAEEDDETGFNHFEARDFDPVIGRWMNVDPYGQHWSPYLSMGNNPVSRVDPDGGFDWEWVARWKASRIPGGFHYKDPFSGEWAVGFYEQGRVGSGDLAGVFKSFTKGGPGLLLINGI
jgi:RHS repeat-associated protein